MGQPAAGRPHITPFVAEVKGFNEMLLERFATPGLAQVAYIVADPQQGAAGVI